MDDTVSSPEVKIDRTLLLPSPVGDFVDLFKRLRAEHSFALRKRYWRELGDPALINRIFAATINSGGITDSNRLFVAAFSEGRTRIRWAKGGSYATLLDYREVKVSLWKGGLFWVWGWTDKGTGRRVRVKPWGTMLDVARLIFRRPEPEEFVALVNEEVKPVWERIESGELRVDHREITWEERYAWVRAAKPVVLPFYKAAGLVTSVVRRAPTAKKLWEALPEEVRDVVFGFSSEEHREFLRLAEVAEEKVGTDYFRVRRSKPGNGTFLCILET